MTATTLRSIGSTEIFGIWPKILPFIETAMATSSYDTPVDVAVALEKGTAQLWLVERGGAIEAVTVTQIEENSKGSNCSIWICTGHRRQDWQHHLSEIEEFAKAMGCSVMRHMARPGWARVLRPFGYKTTHVLIEKELLAWPTSKRNKT